ncbi:TPA: hypothetical protein ACYSAQ_003440 [Morganella morganii]
MFLNKLQDCNYEMAQLICCGDRSPCNCEDSLTEDYYSERKDSYDCQKKMNTYAIKYGLSYISEIYHYLEKSKILNKFRGNSPLNVISLGCGFAPDYYALSKYNDDNKLNIQINYTGLDISTAWNTARPNAQNCSFQYTDLRTPFSLQNAHIVFVCKSFSTMYKNGYSRLFLDQLELAINSSLPRDSIIVFIDVNLDSFGRDEFHNSISLITNSNTQYFFSGSTYTKPHWIEIESTNIIYDIEQTFLVEFIDHTNKTIVFEYRK